jgi:hypothetical protein
MKCWWWHVRIEKEKGETPRMVKYSCIHREKEIEEGNRRRKFRKEIQGRPLLFDSQGLN